MPPSTDSPAAPGRRRLLAACAAGGLACLALPGCAAFDYRGADAPVALAAVPPLEPRPRIALVLGPGGPRGHAHIGVMRVLEEAGIEPDLLVGTSVGALLGVLWAGGMSAAQIDERAARADLLTVFDPSPFADRGWVHGQRLQDYVNQGVGGRRLQELPRRVVVVATRRSDRSPRFFMRGNAGVAVRASAAVPGLVSPVGIAGVEYEDGDSSLPLAVSAARSAGARFVIAVNVYARPGQAPADLSDEMRERDRVRHARIAREVAQADFLLHPDVGYHASPFHDFAVECRRRGEALARAELPALLGRLAALGPVRPA